MKHTFLTVSHVSIFIIIFLMISQITIVQSSPLSNLNNHDTFHFENDIMHNIYFDDLQSVPPQQPLSTTNDLPDLVFETLKTWWGPINTSTEGLFVRYEIKNIGYSYNHSKPIKSNLTFYANEESSPFGFIIQTPFFYPEHWYEGEILGGNFFFDNVGEKPQKIKVTIDTNNSISESNEDNNNQTITVIDGVIISGTIYSTENDINTPFSTTVQIRGCDPQSLLDIEYRTFRSDEHGMYKMSFYPEEPSTNAYQYHLLIKALNHGTLLLSTPLLRSGQHCTLNAYFKGREPEQPQLPIGLKRGLANRSYPFFTSSQDIDEDLLSYKFSWGDGNYSNWIGPVESNKNIWLSHSWSNPDTYTIRVISKDETGLLSDWSNSFQISIRDILDLNVGWIIDFIKSILSPYILI